MKQWFVVYTQLMKEVIAQQNLLQQGFDAYLPRFKKIRRHARKVETVLAPLFPRYLFVGLDLELDAWRSVNGTQGVSYLLMNHDKPALLSEHIICELKTQENQEGIVPINSLAIFAKGDRIRINEGVFEGHVGIFEKLDDKQRAQLLLSFLGREVKVVLSQYALEAA